MPHTCVTLEIAILQAVYDGCVYFAVQSSGVCTCVQAENNLTTTSSLWPFKPALGPSGLLDFVIRALRALRLLTHTAMQ